MHFNLHIRRQCRRKRQRDRCAPTSFCFWGRLLKKTNTMNTLTKTLFALTMMLPLAGLGQCETCEPDLSCVAVDFPVLCPEQLPNATQGEPYSASATFNLPPSVVDPGSGLEATLLTVTISSVTGLPFGLEFSPKQPRWRLPAGQRRILWLFCSLRDSACQRLLFRQHQRDRSCVCVWVPANCRRKLQLAVGC